MKKVVIITGAGSGIGKASAEMLANKGFTVYGVDRNEIEAQSIAGFVADVNDYQAMGDVFNQIFEREGRIDALVNNAGIGIGGAIEDASIENIQAIVNTNLVSMAVLCKLIIPFLKHSKGRIVNIGSVGGIIPLPYQAMYSATKSAIEVFSRALATEVRPFGIKVTCVMPGDTKTGFTDARIKEFESGENAKHAEKFVGKMEHDEKTGMSPKKVAKVVTKALTTKKRILRITVGGSYKFIVFLSRILPVKMINFIVRKMYS